MEEKKRFYKSAVINKKGFEQAAAQEADRRLMESYYPPSAGYLQALVTDACDRLDYEGSFIYDEYPDKNTIERICGQICGQAESCSELQGMENRGTGEMLGNFVGVLFCQEVCKRRQRRKMVMPVHWRQNK